MTQNAMRFTEQVTTKWASRLTGSPACQQCADYLQETLKEFCQETTMQEFKVRPGAFLGYIRINVVLYIFALVALWFNQYLLATLIASLALLIILLEFFFYKEFVDFLFPEKTGKNVVGIIEPEGVVQQQIIVSAHHDSAHIFNFLQENPKSYSVKILSGMLSLFAMTFFTWILLSLYLVGIASFSVSLFIKGLLTVLMLPVIRLWFFYDAKNGTPGAGDNMICTAVAIEIGRYFAQQKHTNQGLKHTRVLVASWDAEEAGLRGARAYVQKNQSALQQIKTYNFNLECLYDHKELSFLTNDLNSFVSLSASMAENGCAVANKLGYKVGTSTFPFLAGGTDAAEFAKAGIEATTLAAMSWVNRGENPAYHTLRDTIEAVDSMAVSKSIDIGIHYILERDKAIVDFEGVLD